MRAMKALVLSLMAVSYVMAQPGGGSPALRQASQLDVEGKYGEARALIQKEIETAATPRAKAQALRVMAMSYAFERNCTKVGEYEQQVIDFWVTREKEEPGNAFYQQGEMANEAARVCIDAGELNAAEHWYRRGTELGSKEPGISVDRKALWKFRLEHALGRLAARRGKKADAAKHVAAARAALDSMTDLKKQQESYFPYLVGYVALYTGDPKGAIAEFEKGNVQDAYVQALMAEAYEKLGEAAKAREHWEQAAKSKAHNPVGAYVIPLARKKLL